MPVYDPDLRCCLVTDLNDVENEARRLLNNDEIEAIKRHLVNVSNDF